MMKKLNYDARAVSGGNILSLYAGKMPSLMYFAFNLVCSAVGWLTAHFSRL